jgi:cytochrome c oxidase subunit 1
MLLFTMAMTFAGSFGVPRRHWDISFTNAAFDVQFSPAVDVLLALVALGGLTAALGAFMFIAIAVKSVFLGEPVGEIVKGRATAGLPHGLTHPPVHAPNVDELNEALHAPGRGMFGPAPGTLALVGVFLLAFVLYYFMNWKILSFLWKIG